MNRHRCVPLARLFHPAPFLLLLMLSGFSRPATAQGDKLNVIVAGGGQKSAVVGSMRRNGILYASVEDLAASLGFRTAADQARGQVEWLLSKSRMRLTGNNPFVVILEGKIPTILDVHQLPHDVLSTARGYYIPVESFLPLLGRIWERTVRFLPATASISVGAAEPSTSQPESAAKKDIPHGTKAGTTSFDIPRLSVESRRNGTLIRIHSRKNLTRFESTLTGAGELVVTIAGATVDAGEIAQTPLTDEFKKIEAVQQGTGVRLHFLLQSDAESCDITKDARSHDLLVALYRGAGVDSIYAAEMQAKKKKADQKKSRWKLDVIVLDAGHGGKDPGTIGVAGIKEKHVALGIALKLGKLIETRMKQVRVVYTRDSDRFVELDRRGQIANEEQGKLFISIHCNATEKKPSDAEGFEVYLLRPGRTDDAIRIAEVENAVIRLEKDYEQRYAKLTNENFILINLAQSSYMKYSERFAELLHQETVEDRPARINDVKQAGFLVLVGASMPSVLVETGFLSNRSEEKFLASQEGQQRIAARIFRAIERYSREYDQALEK